MSNRSTTFRLIVAGPDRANPYVVTHVVRTASDRLVAVQVFNEAIKTLRLDTRIRPDLITKFVSEEIGHCIDPKYYAGTRELRVVTDEQGAVERITTNMYGLELLT